MNAIDGIEILTDPDNLDHFGRDWTRFWPPRPEAIAFPKSTADVVELVKWARRTGRRLVPSGGRTGLSGGAVAPYGEVVVSLEKMRALIEIDTVDASLSAQAGMPVGEVQRLAAEQGLCYPVDWAAAGSSHLGGSIATNAGGIRVLRYGMTRDWVRGVTVVTGSGEVLELNRGLVKNNTGLDLRHLMIGSEGVLGIITEATVGLTSPPPEQSVLLLGFTGLKAIMSAFADLRAGLNLSAFEFFDQRSVDHVADRTGQRFPLDESCPFYAVVEFDDPGQGSQEQALALFEQLLDAGHVADGTISQSGAQASELWHWREAISESISECTPYKNDLSVRVSRVPAFLEALDGLLGRHYPDFEVVWFGHIGDGNLHMNVLKPHDWSVEDFHDALRRLSPKVFDLVRQFEGSVSAEHGVGLLKRDDLHYSRTDAEIGLMRWIKQHFDPDGILNPGKMFRT
ncbi:FAD-binding oxidoreductase [Wenzhouxiangella sp. AB-CW3]|uniref:FAD-binding oxidoreductase n=1 Tax=Wenzhouxiangella sp. AB-CW3 TaxID=2771012 RepID=UPI00168BC9F0|nr:FAD-binding oxidoreductase [Wenzhouxiangella sp. AB-CW3]QOC23949.1 FAD-binding oxidoreductase [Wenzhouxiangella sp. AB-CW3]